MDAGTTTALLVGLQDPENRQVCESFCGRYSPILEGFARKLGLGGPDALDVAQETLCEFLIAYRRGGYDPQRGRLRKWLFGIAAHKVHDVQRRQCREHALGQASSTDAFDRIADDHTLSGIWDAQWQRAIVRQAIREVRREVGPATFQAFALTFLKGWPNEQAAEKLGMTANAVSKAKRRVLSRLEEIRGRLEQDW